MLRLSLEDKACLAIHIASEVHKTRNLRDQERLILITLMKYEIVADDDAPVLPRRDGDGIVE